MQTLINIIFGAVLAALTLGPAAWAGTDLSPDLGISASASPTSPIVRHGPTDTPDGP
jgi:hypothetical protein